MLKIDIDYKVKSFKDSKQEEKTVAYSDMSYNYVTYAVSKKYQDGLEGQLRRMWGRIQRKFEEAIDTKKGEVNLETNELEFIQKAFNECKFPADVSHYVTLFEEELNK